MAALALALVAALLVLVAVIWAWTRDRRELQLRDAEVATLRRQLERGEELEGHLSAALDAIDMGVLLARPDGTVVFRNDAAGVFAGARHSAALVEAAVDELLAQALRGQPGKREVDLFGPPSSAYLVRSYPLTTRADGDEQLAGAFVLVEDITERRRIDQVRRDFVANISHELRTPIGAIAVSGELVADSDDATARRLAENMAEQAVRVSNTIDDLLQLASIEFGDDTEVEPVEVAEVVEQAVARLAEAAEQRGVTIRTVFHDRPVVQGDRLQLRSAIVNLVDNAVKYDQPGGTVTVEVKVADGNVVLEVTDDGVGIPARDLDRVFERFYRVDRARSRETGGTGLGLAIVRHIASNHGGEVTVTSQEGVGSTFALVLPLERPGGHR